MAELSRLKKFMLCTFIVAIASFLVMFYYSVNFSKYTRIGVKYVTTITNGNLGRDSHEQALLSNDSSASEEGKIDIVSSIETSVRSQPTEKKSIRLMSEDETALQSTSKSSKSGSTVRLSAEAKKPTTLSTTSSTRQPILRVTTSNTQSNIAQELCPEKSSSLGESFLLSSITSDLARNYMAIRHFFASCMLERLVYFCGVPVHVT